METLRDKSWKLEVRMWAMTHFRVLPTERRYLDMPFEWLEALFLNYLNSPAPEDLRKKYHEYLVRQKKSEEIDKLYGDLISDDMGWTPEQAKAIMDELKGKL